MWSPTNLKILNENTAGNVEQMLVECEPVILFQSSDKIDYILGVEGSRLLIIPVVKAESYQVR